MPTRTRTRDGDGRRAMTPHDRRRLRTTWIVTATGPVLGVIGALVLALIGASGRAGLGVLLLLSSAGCVVAALVTALLAVLDEVRDRPVARRRPIVTGVLFVVAVVLLLMSTGASNG